MAILKSPQLERFLRKPNPETVCVLIYGSDIGAVKERAKAIVKAVAGSLDDPFNTVRLDDDMIARDPGLLADEYAAISMMGGRRAIWVSEAAEGCAKAVETLLGRPPTGNLIIAEAGNLAKKAKLRTMLEAAPSAAVIACYEDSDQDLRELILQEAKKASLNVEEEAMAELLELLGGDRALSRQEISKLVIYCHGRSTVKLEDVEAVCSDAAGFSTDAAIDAALEGDLDVADSELTKLVASGVSGSRALSALGLHVARLQQWQADIASGRNAEQVMRSARPPVFFKRQASVGRQLKLWDEQNLFSAGASIGAAILQTRQYGDLEDAIASRTFLSLARNARANRYQRN
jgi:DNA polymerase-3 subunit delta